MGSMTAGKDRHLLCPYGGSGSMLVLYSSGSGSIPDEGNEFLSKTIKIEECNESFR